MILGCDSCTGVLFFFLVGYGMCVVWLVVVYVCGFVIVCVVLCVCLCVWVCVCCAVLRVLCVVFCVVWFVLRVANCVIYWECGLESLGVRDLLFKSVPTSCSSSNNY